MSSVIQQQIDYLPSETELRQILGNRLPDVFIRDYAAAKRNINIASQATDGNTQDVSALEQALSSLTLQFIAVRNQVIALDGEVDNIQITITALDGRVFTVETGLASHIAAESAHGANGSIVGTNNYCTATVGGTVLLAGALPDVGPVTTTPPGAVATAGAAYSQTYAQSQADAINALRQNVTDLVAANNSLVSAINQMLSTERTAKQRAT
jgi:hypothetical protein